MSRFFNLESKEIVSGIVPSNLFFATLRYIICSIKPISSPYKKITRIRYVDHCVRSCPKAKTGSGPKKKPSGNGGRAPQPQNSAMGSALADAFAKAKKD